MSENGQLRELFPPLEPFDTGFLPEADGHRVYYVQSGNPAGEPLI
jgi:proline iminopeptidase